MPSLQILLTTTSRNAPCEALCGTLSPSASTDRDDVSGDASGAFWTAGADGVRRTRRAEPHSPPQADNDATWTLTKLCATYLQLPDDRHPQPVLFGQTGEVSGNWIARQAQRALSWSRDGEWGRRQSLRRFLSLLCWQPGRTLISAGRAKLPAGSRLLCQLEQRNCGCAEVQVLCDGAGSFGAVSRECLCSSFRDEETCAM